jgi:hypothetical protein
LEYPTVLREFVSLTFLGTGTALATAWLEVVSLTFFGAFTIVPAVLVLAADTALAHKNMANIKTTEKITLFPFIILSPSIYNYEFTFGNINIFVFGLL